MEPLQLATDRDIETARQRLSGLVHRTPLVPLALEGAPFGIFLKLENLQPFGSFKLRAATNAIRALSDAESERGILTSSTGNFGQGLAAAAQRLGVPCTVIVPDTTAPSKLEALRHLGARIHQISFDDWWHVLTTRQAPGFDGRFIHPVAEPEVIAGNATVGLEILEDLPDVDTILVPVGGGGLASGIASALAACGSKARLIAAETDAAGQMGAALAADKPVEVDYQKTFIDGAGGRTVLAEMWPLLRQVIDGAVQSSVQEVVDAIRRLASEQSLIAEGAGATPLAAALAGRGHRPGRKTVCVVSGGNLDKKALIDVLSGRIPRV
jgi:threonine dehydratase